MYAVTYSSVLSGLDSIIVQVEVNLSKGIPSYSIVGLPDMAVKESKERIYSAIVNSNLEFPVKKIVINLAPADIKKEGSYFDLPIAISIILAYKKNNINLKNIALIGELSLDGKCRPVNGILPLVITLKNKNIKNFIIPYDNKDEASLIKDINIYPVKTLNETIELINNKLDKKFIYSSKNYKTIENNYLYDFSEIRGQLYSKRALEISAAGGHNILFVGSPGVGKTMLAKRFPTILPPMSHEESIQTTLIYSVAGEINRNNPLINKRPFQAPHHTISDIAMIGGGSRSKPGVVSLAHNGVLFLDEFSEFSRKTLEVLRQPLEDGIVTISRIKKTNIFPARFILIATMNPCPCGYKGDRYHNCTCTPGDIKRYMKKISGPLLDRIDIQIEIPSLTFEELFSSKNSESSETISKRVTAAKKLQRERYKDNTNLFSNAKLSNDDINKYCIMDKDNLCLLKKWSEQMHFSARTFYKILKISRTIADIDQSEIILKIHLSEAISYRFLDKNLIF